MSAIAIWPSFSFSKDIDMKASKALLENHYKEGWILDNFQGMAHSESMGMGLLAAVNTNDRNKFELLWKNVKKLQRDDGLFSWQYDLNAKNITDYNNATDGEIYIASALFKAASTFKEPSYKTAAIQILAGIKTLLVPSEHGLLLLPGQYGFNDKHIAINLSYYVYPAFVQFKKETNDPIWDQLTSSGLALTEKAMTGRYQLPTDWTQVSKTITPWAARPPVFGYDAIRIPLYVYAVSPKHPVISKYIAFSTLKKPTVDVISDQLPNYSSPPGMLAITSYVRGGYQFKTSKDYYDVALQVMIESFGN